MHRAHVSWIAITLCAIHPLKAATESPDSRANEHIIQQLTCLREPNPTPTLHYFLQKKIIRLRDAKGADSVNCWRLTKSYNLAGLPVVGVCAFEEDPFVRTLYPGLYWRGPGTSPGQLLSVLTVVGDDVIKDWIKKHGIQDAIRITPAEDWMGMPVNAIQIECNASSIKP
jgi:hypothetical protein